VVYLATLPKLFPYFDLVGDLSRNSIGSSSDCSDPATSARAQTVASLPQANT
jgi:hypothetical protein